MKTTTMKPGFGKLIGIVLLVITLTLLLLAFTQAIQNLTASVCWHDLASVGWVTVPG